MSSSFKKYLAIRTMEDVAELVRNSRKKQNLTQKDLAGLAGTGQRFIVDLEKAKPTCEIEKVLSILRVLGIKLLVEDE